MAPLAQLQAPGAHVILAAEANFKMHSGATEELGEAMVASVMHGSLGAHTGSFSKRSTSDSSVLAKSAVHVAHCAEHPTQYLGLTTPSRGWRVAFEAVTRELQLRERLP